MECWSMSRFGGEERRPQIRGHKWGLLLGYSWKRGINYHLKAQRKICRDLRGSQRPWNYSAPFLFQNPHSLSAQEERHTSVNKLIYFGLFSSGCPRPSAELLTYSIFRLMVHNVILFEYANFRPCNSEEEKKEEKKVVTKVGAGFA